MNDTPLVAVRGLRKRYGGVVAVDNILKPMLDMIWNAVGHEKCPRYDANGKWHSW